MYNSRQRQNRLQKLLVVDLDPTIAVRVELGERLGDLLHDDARAHEAIKRDSGWSGLVTPRWRNGPFDI